MSWNRIPHFVFYDQAYQLLDKVQWIFEQTSLMQKQSGNELYDIESMSIVGMTGAGKSTFCRFFQSLYPRKSKGDVEIIPVVHVKLESSITGLTGLYLALLEPFGWPFSVIGVSRFSQMKIAQYHMVLKTYIRKAETKIIFLDEFQHIYQTRKNKHFLNQAIVNHLKIIMEEVRVAIIPVGVLGVEEFLKMDSQLVGRCPIKPYSRLEYWEYPSINEGIDIDNEFMKLKKQNHKLSTEQINNLLKIKIKEIQVKNKQIRLNFRKLLKGFEQFLPFLEPSNLSSPITAELLFNKVQFTRIEEGPLGKTNLRKIAWFLRKAGNLALQKKHSKITSIDIEETVF
ncbi:TniB family NTP-binding protein [Candidatus Lokiarchaeum ossiferum]|uniref:TniB family NTP-binding protein n=1 Tax=Candidatus Lokiarchaeum ossiferum TaxID=2951803 RepID=UPI00352EB560